MQKKRIELGSTTRRCDDCGRYYTDRMWHDGTHTKCKLGTRELHICNPKDLQPPPPKRTLYRKNGKYDDQINLLTGKAYAMDKKIAEALPVKYNKHEGGEK